MSFYAIKKPSIAIFLAIFLICLPQSFGARRSIAASASATTNSVRHTKYVVRAYVMMSDSGSQPLSDVVVGEYARRIGGKTKDYISKAQGNGVPEDVEITEPRPEADCRPESPCEIVELIEKQTKRPNVVLIQITFSIRSSPKTHEVVDFGLDGDPLCLPIGPNKDQDLAKLFGMVAKRIVGYDYDKKNAH